MNELLQQVPPNVSIPDTPDLDSLILLQERRRRMSSGGTSVSSIPTSATSPQPQQQQQAGIAGGPQGRFQPPQQQLQVVQNQQQQPQQHRGQLLMQQLTSGSTTVSRSSSSVSMTSTPSVTRSISYIEQLQSNNQFNGNNSAVTVSSVPQVLARRSSFSGGLPQLPNPNVTASAVGGPNINQHPQPSMISPPPGASAAAAAVAAAAAASTANTHHRPPQRHASGGSTLVHHVLRGNPASGSGTNRRLSDSLENAVSDEKQRSLLQQLLSE